MVELLAELDAVPFHFAEVSPASSDAELVRVQCELANARAELKRLRRRARRCAPAIAGRRGLGRRRGTAR